MGDAAPADERAALPPRASPAEPLRALVAGDLATLGVLVQRVAGDGVKVVAVVSDGEALVEAFRRHRPDVVLAEWRLPDLNGREALERLLAIDPAARLVFLSASEDLGAVRDAIAAGASGYLLASACPVRLWECLRAAACGHVVLDGATGRALAGARPADEEPMPDGRLSSRERTVLRLVAAGCTNQEIGERLGIRLSTVKTHLARISRKLGVHGRVAAAREAGALDLL